MVDFAKLKERAAQTSADLTKPSAGGDDFPVAAAGACRLRFVGYVEIGNHTTQYQGQSKDKPRCVLIFEVSGPKHPPLEVDGKKMPHLVTIRETVGTNEKSNYIKLFKLMSKDTPGATNFLDLLGNPYRGTLVHESKDAKNPKPNDVYVRLRNDAGYTILPVTYEDPETGEPRTVQVAEPLTPMRVLLWDLADLEQWDTLKLPGENQWLQETVRKANNFKGSALYTALAAGGRTADLEPPTNKKNEPAQQAAPAQESAPPADQPKAGPSVTTPAPKQEVADEDIPW